jgi:RNA polymerase sigma-70 factor, Bacteroides expansion family 1
VKANDKLDEQTVKSFVAGDMRAFDDIYLVISPKLQRFVFSFVKTEGDAEEIVQDVFVKMWENRGKLRSFGSFESYIFTIAYNATISLIRKRSKENSYIEYVKSVQIEIDDSAMAENQDWEEIDQKLNLLIEQMPPRQKEVFKMKHFQGSSYKEIAENLGVSVNTVENHIVKAHKFLKENFGKNYLSALLFIHLFL